MFSKRSRNSIVKCWKPSVFAMSLLLGCVTVTSLEAQHYPSTQYNGFGSPIVSGGDFATGQPFPDLPQANGIADHTAMSPDSWGQPVVGGNNSFQPRFAPTNPPIANGPRTEYGFEKMETPSVPDLKQSSPFQSSSFSAQNSNANRATTLPNSQKTLNAKGENSVFQNKAASPGNSRYPLSSENGLSASKTSFANNGELSIKHFEAAQFHNGNPVETSNANPFAPSANTFPPSQNLGASSPQFSSSPNSQFSVPQGVSYDLTGSTVVTGEQIQGSPVFESQPVLESQPVFGDQSNGTFQSVFGQEGASATVPTFGGDVGFRSPAPTVRHHGSFDSGKKYDFEDKKKEYPPLSEIFATGRYFGSARLLFLRPSFQNNTAISTLGSGFAESTPYDFDYEAAPNFRFGFESKFGPGIEFNYWQFDETSNDASFVSDGVITGSTSGFVIGPNQFSGLTAANAGETLVTNHSIDVEVLGVSFFKEVKLPIARINGMFGLQYTSIAQSQNAILTNGGTEIGSLTSRSDMRAYGPKFGFEYYRPVGHTKLEFITTLGVGILFGQRDQFIGNTVSNDFSRVGADELITTFDLGTGVQYKKLIAENRAFFVRAGFLYQSWLGGGSAIDAQDDFGVRGISFSVGYNR